MHAARVLVCEIHFIDNDAWNGFDRGKNEHRKGIAMIITRDGEIIQYFLRKNGVVVKDGDFSICLEYNEEQKKQFERISELKTLLSESDYKAIKFSDGVLTEEEYAPIREKRQAWRNEINEIEKVFTEPIITKEEMEAAKKAALEKYKRERKM